MKYRTQRTEYQGYKHPNWKGGKIKVGGYIYVWSPEHPNKTKMGYVCEHRLKMEKKLGRFLNKGEVVHHRNHNKLDNRITNLLLIKSAGVHFISEHFRGRDSNGKFI